MSHSNWINTIRRSDRASVTLVLFHYAGGSSGVFRSLCKGMGADAHIVAVDLPGRAKRFTEPPVDSVDAAATQVAKALRESRANFPSCDLVFFGHSLGAKLAMEVAHLIGPADPLKIRRLIASGSRAPHLPRKGPMLHDLPREEFIAELRNYGGTPAAILEDNDLLDLLTPMLRADFKLAETYQWKNFHPISSDIHVFGGERDAMVEPEQLDAWSTHTTGRCHVRLFSGGHFFLHEDEAHVAAAIDDVLASARQEIREGAFVTDQ